MSSIDISLIAVEVKKWDLETSKITTSCYYLLDKTEHNLTFEISLLHPAEMVEEFLGLMRVECEKALNAGKKKNLKRIKYDNETFLRQKLHNYFKRITGELNNPRRKKGQPKMIYTTHMDVYGENQDISFLPQDQQVLVMLNWARKFYLREDWKNAIEPLRALLKANPDYGIAYKWLAHSLKKIRKYDEAMRNYEKYAEIENTVAAWLDLAKSYRKGKLFEKSETIYQKILADEPDNKEALIGIAQIRYATKNNEYIEILDKLNEMDSAWLKEWLNDEFNFRIYVQEKTLLPPVQAAKFLGFTQIFELTQRAFKNDLPSHFNQSRARLSFYREELENWANTMNRFNCRPEEVVLYPDKLYKDDPIGTANPLDGGDSSKTTETKANDEKPGTRVEEILRHIRARKAERLAEQKALEAENADDAPEKPKKDTGKSGKSASVKKRASKTKTSKATDSKIPAKKEPSKRRTTKSKAKTAS